MASGHDGLKVGRLGELGRAHNDGCFMQNNSLAEVAIPVVHRLAAWLGIMMTVVYKLAAGLRVMMAVVKRLAAWLGGGG